MGMFAPRSVCWIVCRLGVDYSSIIIGEFNRRTW